MLIFKKIQETVERFDGSYFLVRQLKASQDISDISDFHIIEEVIKSKFHHWKGEEEPDGQNVDMSSLDKNRKTKTWTLQNHKFYGFFDNRKISIEDYRLISIEVFKAMLFSKIEGWNEGSKTESIKAIKIVDNIIRPDSMVYHLNLDENKNKDKIAEWHVYSVFIAFLAINKKNQTVALIEFGQD